MTAQAFTVKGMSCEHCLRAVTGEVTKLPGVRAVDVDLSSGIVTVSADRELGESEMVVAIEEAGYELVRDAPERPR